MINFFSKYKFIFYLSNFILLVLYLFPCSILGYFLYNDCQLQAQLTKDFLVSTNHLYAFGLLSIIGLFTYKNSNQLNFLNLYLILLSIILEILHIFIPVRGFELSDLFGNLLGVSIVLTINFFYRKI
jgi:VanZ family protein